MTLKLTVWSLLSCLQCLLLVTLKNNRIFPLMMVIKWTKLYDPKPYSSVSHNPAYKFWTLGRSWPSIQNMLEKWLCSTTCEFFEKCPNTSKKSQAHLQCVHNKCAKFGECQSRGVRGVDSTKSISSNTCEFFETCPKLPNYHIYIFNVSKANLQSLQNVSLEMWGKLITQSRFQFYSKHDGKIKIYM
jgi:hypothetical protein